jgi:Calcineurin-like phosphoesterase
MRILTFSDLHLGDYRSSPEYDADNLAKLKKLAAKINPDFIINSGDTVSKDACLRDLNKKMGYWEQYLAFKNSLTYPVLETCLTRERTFFADLFNTECEFSLVKDDFAFITFDPLEYGDHTMTPQQIQWLTNEIKKMAGKKMIFNSHVPIAQTTITRAVKPGIYLTQSNLIKKLVVEHAEFAIFLGGHFHVLPELPRREAEILMLMAGCYKIDLAKSFESYFRIIDIEQHNVTVRTINDSMQNILPVFTIKLNKDE